MNIDKLKQVIQAANPEKFNDQVSKLLRLLGPKAAQYTIRLSDVLLAMESTKKWPPYRIGTHGLFFVASQVSATPRYISTGIQWNLRDDNLDHQSDETKQFLIDLLANE